MAYVTVPSRAVSVSGGGTGTTNTLAKFSSGVLADSGVTDDGTTLVLGRNTVQVNTGTSLNWGTTLARLSSPADKQILIRGGSGGAGTDNRLYFGGTGAGNSYIAQNGTDFIFRSSTTDAPTGCSIGQLSIANTTFRAIQGNAAGAGVSLGSSGQYVFTNNTLGSGGSMDTGIARNAAGVVRITDASTGIGALLSTTLVEANTAGSGSPNILATTESGTLLTNEGATAENYHTLPSAAANLGPFTFYCQDTDGIRIVPAASDTIRVAASVSGVGALGDIRTTTVGNSVTLVAINVTEWVATSVVGTWTVT